jgi:hypothetical protein
MQRSWVEAGSTFGVMVLFALASVFVVVVVFDPLLAKPDRVRSGPAKSGNGAGRACSSVVRGYPLGTGHDRCEWHASGTASEGTWHGVVPSAPSVT